MDLINDIKETLAFQNHHEKRSRLEQLSDVFEYYSDLKVEDIVEGINMLLPPALQEKEQRLKEAFFYTINKAVVCHMEKDIGKRVDWNTLVASLATLDIGPLEYALNILGLSGQERYLPILDEYAQNADPEIREWALEAIKEITYRLAHHSDDQKKV